MTAADRREELEAFLWREIKPAPLKGIPEEAARRVARNLVEDILAAADTYATALAAETLDGMVRTRRTSDRREILAEAAAETARRTL